MHDDAPEPAAMPVPSRDVSSPVIGKRGALLLGIGGGAGLGLGILLTVGLYATYTFFTQTVPSTRDSLQVFNELNELRQEINQLNEEKKLKDLEKEEAMRQALSAVTSTVRAPDSATPAEAPPAVKPAEGTEAPPVMKRQDPFADIDEEIERLEKTQKVLNTILDLFTRKKERPKER
jgi:hypothetical protein